MKKTNKFLSYNLIGKIRFALIAAILLFGSKVAVEAQTVIVNYAFNDATIGTPCSAGTSNAAPGVTSTLTTSTGTCTLPVGTATTGSAFTQNPTGGDSISIAGFAAGATNYFQLELSGVTSYQNYQVYFQAQRSNTGPTTADLQYSTDGTTFTSFQTVTVPTAFAAGGAFNFDLSAVSAIEGQANVFFRIVGSGGTGAAGTFRIDNLQVQGQLGVTAANSSISGRVLAGKNGIPRAMVMLSGGNLEEPLYTTTSSFGNYSFSDIPSGQSYVVTVLSKKYSFANPSLIVNLSENITDADFTADEF